MILNVPTGKDFRKQAARFLNAAWSNATEHIVEWSADEDAYDELPDEYYYAAERELPIWLSLAQSGVDHLIKACIADVSPFLLIAGSADKWPSTSKGNVRFSEFRTFDAQDLMKVLRCATSVQPSKGFERAFEERRKDRNEQYHTVPSEVLHESRTLIEYVLQATHELVGSGAWIRMRREHLQSLPEYQVYPDGVSSRLNAELRSMIHVLERAKLRNYLGIEKKKRLYSCPICLRDCTESEYDAGSLQKGVAQLLTTTPGETAIFCVVCGYIVDVQRVRCSARECRGDVMHHGTCLLCHESSDEELGYTWDSHEVYSEEYSIERDDESENGCSVVHWRTRMGERISSIYVHRVETESEAEELQRTLVERERTAGKHRVLHSFAAELKAEAALWIECKALAGLLGCSVELYPIQSGLVRASTVNGDVGKQAVVAYGDAPKFVKLVQVDRTGIRDALLAVREKLRVLASA